MMVKELMPFLREYFFPYGCSLCGKNLLDAKETLYGLCLDCYESIEKDFLENRTENICNYCGKPLISELDKCLSCRNTENYSFDKADVLFPYTGKYQRLLLAYKFQKNIVLGNFFAEKIKNLINKYTLISDTAIVPVPPKPGKIRKTGWDQVEYIAKILEREKNIPNVNRCLKRLTSKSQKELSRENRRMNLRGRIIAKKSVPQNAILIDDVMTTGSTLDACAAALKEAGTQNVYCVCFFYD